ncbi:unnamed protein product [Lymnaea stagnalis]|uniref:FIST C-domain domain-containing protein n=1 Tax=Lymnaea stagnalis TaxID=6523 RepID=A0AAV2IER4_LYMST
MDSPMEPSCLLLFCTNTLWSRSNVTEQSEQSNGNVKTKKVIKELLDKSLPRKCVYHVVVTDGIVGTDCKMMTEEMDEFPMSISLLMLGHSVETEFIPFSFSHSDCRLLTKCWDENGKKIPEFMSTLLQKPVKMVNLYCPMSGIEQEISYSMYRNLRKPLIAGGYVNEKVLKDLRGHTHSSDEGSIVSGLAFCGDGIQVASVLIRNEVEEEAEVDAVIKKLTEYKFPLHHSFGLMYACVGRGMHVYSKPNVESSIFRKYFPNTPLLGFFGNGEIGCCYPPANRSSPSSHVDDVDGGIRLTAAQMKRRRANMETDKQDLEMKHPPKLLHAYTTVMCLISLP